MPFASYEVAEILNRARWIYLKTGGNVGAAAEFLIINFPDLTTVEIYALVRWLALPQGDVEKLTIILNSLTADMKTADVKRIMGID
ncbi:MAG: hypothetical protein GF390_04105 [Candidatus Pacebacteria bacterium]|nr:hypothetical protein [Candidatus Paceibacterota bacterium]